MEPRDFVPPTAPPPTTGYSLGCGQGGGVCLISICILNHDYERFVSSAIESALAQTHPEVETVVVDDASTDGSRERIEKYAGHVRTVWRTERGGQAAAAWTALQAARGDVVIFLDADDALHPHICSRVASAFRKDPALALLQWRLRVVDAAGRPTGQVLPPRPGLLPSGDLRDHVLRVRSWYGQLTSGIAYAAWAARRVLPADLPAGEYGALDHWLNHLIPLLGPVRSLDDVGGDHRFHSGSLSTLAASGAGSAWPRRMIRLTTNTHDHVRRLAAELGRSCPEDARELPDPAFLGWELWSLREDPVGHPSPGDHRLHLTGRAVTAALRQPHFSWRHRAKRAVWLAAIGLLPRRAALATVRRWPPGGPPSSWVAADDEPVTVQLGSLTSPSS